MGARAKVAHVLDRARVIDAILWIQRKLPPAWLTVFTYHRVGHPENAGDSDPALIDVRPDAFDEQVAFMRQHCNIVGLDDVRAHFRGGKLPSRPVLLTFDDGYLDNYSVALPVLRKHQVPATFFIATGFVNDRRIFWWDKLQVFFHRTKRERIELDLGKKLVFETGTESQRKAAIAGMLKFIKKEPGLSLERVFDSLASACEVGLTSEEERALANELLLDWPQIREMRSAGMSIQSHTRGHRVLQTLGTTELREELRGAREDIENALGEPPFALAFPVGDPLKEASHIRWAIQDAGYELGFSNKTGVSRIWNIDRYDIRRVALDVDLPLSYFRAAVAVPELYS